MTSLRLLAFGPYRLDVRERQLLREGQPVSLPPKLLDLLTTLVQHPGHLIAKEELLDAVWGDVAVEEGSLTRAVSSLRQLLGPSPDGEEYLQTVAKRGYRFTASVRDASSDASETVRDPSRVPLPPQLAAPPVIDFVGREPELAAMLDVWQRARAGRPQLLLIAGEPGIGKTRLSLEFARDRAAEATAVLMGCSDACQLWRRVPPDYSGHQPADGGDIETAQRQARDVVLATQRAEHASKGMRSIELALAVRRHDREACRSGRAHDVTQQQQGGFVRPVEVIEDDEDGRATGRDGEHRGDGLEQPITLGLRAHRGRAVEVGNAAPQLRDR